IVGGSFGESFFGNCVILGIPCMVASQADLEWLQKEIERAPHQPVAVHVERQEVHFGDRVIQATMPEGPRNQLVGGTWDSTAVLLEAGAGRAAGGPGRAHPHTTCPPPPHRPGPRRARGAPAPRRRPPPRPP